MQSNLVIPVTIPEEWLGLNVEVIAFPLDIPHSDNIDLIKKRRQKRVDMLKNYKFKKGEYIFDREEANNYE